MKPMEQAEVYLQRHNVPCFLADVDSSEILFLNDKMKQLLGEKDVVGEKFYHVLRDDVKQADGTYATQIPRLDWVHECIHKNRIYDSVLKAKFDCAVYLISFMRKSYLLCEYMPFDHTLGENYNLEVALAKAVTIMEKGEEVLDHFLHLLSEFYACERCNIYQIRVDLQEIHLSHNWHYLDGMTVTYDIGQKMPVSLIMEWLGTRNSSGIVEVSREQIDPHPIGMQMLDCFGLDNIVISIIEDENGIITGGIGLFDRKDTAIDYCFLQAIREFMKQELSKNSMTASVENIVYLDLLTGFYRRPYYTMIAETIHLAPPPTMGVIFANVNGLKTINDQFGYATGDSYLIRVADLLRNHFLVDFYRISGDEFVGLFLGVEKDVLEELVSNLRESLTEEEKDYFSIGHAWGEKNYKLDALVREADAVMYINKQEYYHRNQIPMEYISNHTLVELLTALGNQEFLVYLQPQVRLHDGSIYGAEALIRRISGETGKMIPPDMFIPVYEKNSVIRHIDIFVIEEVCKFLSRCKGEGKKVLPISVNLSRVTLQEYDIVRIIKNICDKYQISTEYIVIEVTERLGLVENNVASALIQELHDLGFKISLDDFGCAYSNIITLAQVDIDEVKLDKSLVDDVTINRKNKVLVDSVIKMCEALGDNSTLAEGIETEEQAVLLRDLNCHLGQGYFYSRPIPLAEFHEKYLK